MDDMYKTLIAPDMLHKVMDHPQINDTIILCNELLVTMLKLSHFWTALEKWVKYYQRVNLELLKCEIDLIFFECTGKYKKIINLLMLITKRFICVTKCNEFLRQFYLINHIGTLNHVEKITVHKNYRKEKHPTYPKMASLLKRIVVVDEKLHFTFTRIVVTIATFALYNRYITSR